MYYDYEVIRSNRKTMSMGFKGTKLIVRAPLRSTDADIRSFIHQNNRWIDEHYKKAREREVTMLEVPKLTQDEIIELKDIAEEVIPKRVAHYARLIGVTYGKISIGTQRTLWGSCSSKGNLSFNCLLMLTPIEVIDSVIVHELCHRKEMNHSNRFYAEVLRVFPDYWEKNKWLTEHAFRLKAMLKAQNETTNDSTQNDDITRTRQETSDIQWKSKSINVKQGLALLIQPRIACNSYHTVFVRLDGTVVATERGYSNATLTLSKWTNILAVAAEGTKIIGLRSNGYVIGVDAESGKRDCTGYHVTTISKQGKIICGPERVAIEGKDFYAALNKDGTVFTRRKTMDNPFLDSMLSYMNVRIPDGSTWRNIVAIDAGQDHLVGLRVDGTVVASGSNEYGQCDVSHWSNIIAIAAGNSHTVGVTTNGEVLSVGSNGEGQCNVTGWKDIVSVVAMGNNTFGIKIDGYVVGTGEDIGYNCRFAWKLFNNIDTLKDELDKSLEKMQTNERNRTLSGPSKREIELKRLEQQWSNELLYGIEVDKRMNEVGGAFKGRKLKALRDERQRCSDTISDLSSQIERLRTDINHNWDNNY